MPDIDLQRTPRRLWIAAAIVALLLHLGGAALALVHLKGAEFDEGLGASGAEIAIEIGAPRVDENDAPAGAVDDVAEQAAPQRTEQTAEVKQEDLPRDKPTVADDADRVVTPSETRPEKEEQKVAAVKAEASEASETHVDSARTGLDVDAPVTERTKAPNAGLGRDLSKLTADWGRRISAYFELHKKYPEGKKGNAKVKVTFVLNRTGKVLSSGIIQSSGDAGFDEAALAMIKRSDPVPPPPAGLTDDQFPFSIEVTFTPAGSKPGRTAR